MSVREAALELARWMADEGVGKEAELADDIEARINRHLHPADDDEELTKDWLLSAIKKRHSYWPSMWLTQQVNMEAQDGICVVYCGGEVVCEIETRGDFRRLLKVLGEAQ